MPITDMRLPSKISEQRLIHLAVITKTMQKGGFLLSPGVRNGEGGAPCHIFLFFLCVCGGGA